MSAYDNVVGGKLKLKGKALDVKAGGIKKKKKHKTYHDQTSQIMEKNDLPEGGSVEQPTEPDEEDGVDVVSPSIRDGKASQQEDNLTPAEKRYIEQRANLDVNRLAKTANKSHRDRIQDFNQYLANMSEHYDIPKVGPG